MSKNSVIVNELPECDICRELVGAYSTDSRAFYDGKTTLGVWANMCQLHFLKYGIGIGTGKGQRLLLQK